MDCSPPGSSVHEDSPGKNTGVGCHALLRGIFLTQESNEGLLHCRRILYQLSYQGSPIRKGSHEYLRDEPVVGSAEEELEMMAERLAKA